MRMYFLTMYNLSGIQKGIQAGHAALEYAYEYGGTEDYQNFIRNHKTFIVLNGGTSSTMEVHRKTLLDAGIKHAIFREPDLNDSLSAIAFLVPERVFNPAKVEPISVWGGLKTPTPEIGTDEWFTAFIRSFPLASN